MSGAAENGMLWEYEPVPNPRRPARLVLAALAVAIGVLVVEVVLVLQRDYITRPEFEVEFVTGGCGPPLRMAVLGDSLVAGLGASDERRSLPGQVAIKVSAATGRSVSVTGFGVSGAVTGDVLSRQLPEVASQAFDVIVIEIGSNDVTHRTSLRRVERQTRLMLKRARARAPIVVLGSSGRLNTPNFLPPLRQIVMARATSVRARQVRIARDLDVPVVDVAREISPTYDRTAGSSSRDAFHPSDIGYEIWARPLAARVVSALEPDGSTCGTRRR